VNLEAPIFLEPTCPHLLSVVPLHDSPCKHSEYVAWSHLGISWMIREVNQKPSNTWNGHGKHSYMMATWQYEQCSKSVVDDGWWLYGTNNCHHGKPRSWPTNVNENFADTTVELLQVILLRPAHRLRCRYLGDENLRVIQLTYWVYQLPHLWLEQLVTHLPTRYIG